MLFAAHRQAFAAFGSTAFQYETAVLAGHAHQEPVRALAMTRIRLKSANALCHEIPSEENEPSMLANGFKGCQSARTVLQSASFSDTIRPQ